MLDPCNNRRPHLVAHWHPLCLLFGLRPGEYGPSSPHAEYVADSCSNDITVISCFGEDCKATVLPGVPTCGEWKPDPYAALKMFTCTKVCPPA